MFCRVETRREREKRKKTGEGKAKARKRAYSKGWSLLRPPGWPSWAAALCLPLWTWCCPTTSHCFLNACFEEAPCAVLYIPLPALLVLLLIPFHT